MRNKWYVVLLALFYNDIAISSEMAKIPVANLIKAAEVKYALPEGLLGAIIKVESAGRHWALNPDDGNAAAKERGLKVPSYGLMQIQLDTARDIQIMKAKDDGIKIRKNQLITAKLLRNPETNIEYGAYYLRFLLDSHNNDISWALTCYNGGRSSLVCRRKKYVGDYVGKVLNALME